MLQHIQKDRKLYRVLEKNYSATMRKRWLSILIIVGSSFLLALLTIFLIVSTDLSKYPILTGLCWVLLAAIIFTAGFPLSKWARKDWVCPVCNEALIYDSRLWPIKTRLCPHCGKLLYPDLK